MANTVTIQSGEEFYTIPQSWLNYAKESERLFLKSYGPKGTEKDFWIYQNYMENQPKDFPKTDSELWEILLDSDQYEVVA